MKEDLFFVEGKVKIFDKEISWMYVCVPQAHSDELAGLAERGLIAMRACIGNTAWDTSLLPMGDGSHYGRGKRQSERNEKRADAYWLLVHERIKTGIVTRFNL